MMGVHDEHARLERAMANLTVGFQSARQRVSAEREPLSPADMQHHIQVPVKGNAGSAPAEFVVTVGWQSHPFLTRLQVTENDVEPANPQFTFGYELQSAAPVMMTACVQEWLEDGRGLIDSARVRIFAVLPGASQIAPFTGVLHLTFTGYAAPVEDDDDDTATTVNSDITPNGPGAGITLGDGVIGT